MSEYDDQATAFLAKHHLTMEIERAAQQLPAHGAGRDMSSGLKYHVRISKRKGGTISFPFWGSIVDRRNNVATSEYAVLANLSINASFVGYTYQQVLDEFGWDAKSKDGATAERVVKFAARLAAFFTEAELTDLQEIS